MPPSAELEAHNPQTREEMKDDHPSGAATDPSHATGSTSDSDEHVPDSGGRDKSNILVEQAGQVGRT